MQRAVKAKLLGHREHINRSLHRTKGLHRFINLLVAGIIEALRLQDVANHGVSVLFEHQCAKHSLLKFSVVRRKLACFARNLRLVLRTLLVASRLIAAIGICSAVIVCHNPKKFIQ